MHTQHTLCWEAVAFKCMSFNMCYGCVLNAGNRCACMCVECSCALCTHAIVWLWCSILSLILYVILLCCHAKQRALNATFPLYHPFIYEERFDIFFRFSFSFLLCKCIFYTVVVVVVSITNTFTVFCINYGGFSLVSDMTDVFLAFYFSCKLQLILLIRFLSSRMKIFG